MDDLVGGVLGFMLLGDLLKSKAGATIIMLTLAVTIPSCIGYTIWNIPVAKTNKLIDAQAKVACMSGSSPKVNLNDHWSVETTLDISEDGNGSLFCTSRSAGRDNVFGTDDDLIAKHQNINKSRIVGAWVKDKGIEAIKGAFFGDKRDETKQP